MLDNPSTPAMLKEPPSLRQQAEATYHSNVANAPVPSGPASSEAKDAALFELGVHQIELEMQNDELRKNQLELYVERVRYLDLYNNAPVGYFTLTEQGVVLQANFAADAMVGVRQGALANSRFYRHVLRDDQDIFYLLLKDLPNAPQTRSDVFRLAQSSSQVLWVRMSVTPARDSHGGLTYLVVMVDMTAAVGREDERRRNELALRNALVREVHHRINNSLQGVIGILSRYADAHPQTATPMRQAIGQVSTLSAIHGLRGRGATGAVVLSELIGDIANQVQGLWQSPVTLNIPANWRPSMVVADADAVPVAMILNELMTNAVKHGGLAQGGVEVNVQEGATDGVVQILVCNRGQFAQSLEPRNTWHGGLGLIAALIPRSGAQITRAQLGDTVVTTFELESPVVCTLRETTTAA